MAEAFFWSVAVAGGDTAYLQRVCAQIDRGLASVPHGTRGFRKPEALLAAAAKQPFTLAVLDFGAGGIPLAQELLALCPYCKIIFLCDGAAYAQDAYLVEPIACLLKEDLENHFPRLFEHILNRVSSQNTPPRKVLAASGLGSVALIPQPELIWLERSVRITLLHCTRGVFVSTEKVEELITRLDPVFFCQCHKSYAFNWCHVRLYESKSVHMSNDTEVPISRRLSSRVRASFARYSSMLGTAAPPEEKPASPKQPTNFAYPSFPLIR